MFFFFFLNHTSSCISLSLSCSVKKSEFKSEDAIIVAMFEVNMLLRMDTVRNAGTTTTYVG